jgi:hypothetical protein
MKSGLRLSLILSGVVVACASQSRGLDSESHFQCKLDADCSARGVHSVCVENRCLDTTRDGGPDSSAGTGGGSGMGGGGAARTGTGAVAGRSAMAGNGGGGTGARGPRDPGDAAPDVGDAGGPLCQRCTSTLTPQQSLDCYCAANGCDPTLADALNNRKWAFLERGCGHIYAWNAGGAGGGEMEAFDPATGRLIGAMTWGDVGNRTCIMPVYGPGNGTTAGGTGFDFVSYEETCPEAVNCALFPFDGGFIEAPLCSTDEILTQVGLEAGAPCSEGQIRASVCTLCASGCNRREVQCTRTCHTPADCTSSGAGSACVDRVCQLFCPF